MIVEKRRTPQTVSVSNQATDPSQGNVSPSLVFAIDEKLLQEIVAYTSANVLSLQPQNNSSKHALRKNLLLAALASTRTESC